MLIENESQWNTDDLRAIVVAVMKHEDIAESSFTPNYLVLFKTSRRKHYSTTQRIRAAQTGYIRGGLGGQSVVIDVCSKEKLVEKNLLERLAQTATRDGESVIQDIHPQFIRDIAEVVKVSLSGGYGGWEPVKGYEWAEKLQLRSMPKITRSVEVQKRRILQLEAQKASIVHAMNRELASLDTKIKQIKEKLESDK